ncbi:MAG: hypothetical protein ACXVPN_15240 [Bacteroidia bacterium]
MKYILKITVMLALVAGMISCGGKKGEEQEPLNAPKGMRYLDISKTGMNVYVLTPDSTAGVLDTIAQSSGEYLIKVGNNFQVSILENAGDIAQRKADITNDDVNKLKKYVVDDATTLLWESGIADMSEFHFYHIAKIGDRTYVFEDIKGDPFTQEAAQKMLDACKQAKEKKTGGEKKS